MHKLILLLALAGVVTVLVFQFGIRLPTPGQEEPEGGLSDLPPIPRSLKFAFFLSSGSKAAHAESLKLEADSPYKKTADDYVKQRFTPLLQTSNSERGIDFQVDVVLDRLDQPRDYQIGYATSVEAFSISTAAPNQITLTCKGYLSFLRATETLF